MRLFLHLLLGLLLGPAGTPSREEVVRLEPAQDATLIEDADGALALGSAPSLFAGRNAASGDSIRRALVAFDVAGALPEGSRVLQVRLVLTHVGNNPAPAAVRLHRVLAAWGEGASTGQGGGGAAAEPGDATWIHTFYDASFWTHAGGQFVGRSSAVLDVAGEGVYVWRSARMAQDVRLWLANPRANHGWILVGDETAPQTVKRFPSRESPQAPLRPTLEIAYLPPTPDPAR